MFGKFLANILRRVIFRNQLVRNLVLCVRKQCTIAKLRIVFFGLLVFAALSTILLNSLSAETSNKLRASIPFFVPKSLCNTDDECWKYSDWPIGSAESHTFCHENRDDDMLGLEFCDSKEFYEVAIVVFSQAGNSELREAIRSTWASFLYNDKLFGNQYLSPHLRTTGSKTTLLFFTTMSNATSGAIKESDNTAALTEMKLRGDIILLAEPKAPLSSTQKTMVLYDLISRCGPLRRSRYLLKIMDNMFVHMDPLMDLLASLTETAPSHFILGKLTGEEEAKQLLSAPKSQVPEELLPLLTYTPFIRSLAYIIPVRSVIRVLEQAQCVRLLHNDEVVMNGLLAKRENLQLLSRPTFIAPPHSIEKVEGTIVHRSMSPQSMEALFNLQYI